MVKPRIFSEGFEELLETIPRNTSLEQWQAYYRQVIYLTGLRILERFPTEATSAKGPSVKGPSGGGGQSGGPHNLTELADFVLDLNAPKKKKP
jgi:hypothetical protein